MNSRKFDPIINLAGFERLQEELGKMFNLDMTMDDVTSASTSRWRPAADIVEDGERYVITLDLPGVDPEAITVELNGSVLSVSGARQHSARNTSGSIENQKDAQEFKRQERSMGEFYRQFTLPKTADEQSVTASNANGVLTIEVSKTASSVSRKIHVVKS